MQPPVSPLGKQQPFCFTCSPESVCFNACCRDLNQVLTPYDVLCLKRFLKMSSTDFLNTYTMQSTGPETGLPVVTLRFEDADDLACPFVTEAGCRVYPARPASCRTYPLARGVSRDRQTGHLREHWALIREPHCLGFDNGQPQTVDEWVDDQQIATHNRMNDMMLELISLKKRLRPGPLTPSETQRVYTALYDLDAFHNDRYDKEDGMATGIDPLIDERGIGEQAIADDLKLLRIALRWVKENVFGISLENTKK
jgi:Fe-S-cluster containining protein